MLCRSTSLQPEDTPYSLKVLKTESCAEFEVIHKKSATFFTGGAFCMVCWVSLGLLLNSSVVQPLQSDFDPETWRFTRDEVPILYNGCSWEDHAFFEWYTWRRNAF